VLHNFALGDLIDMLNVSDALIPSHTLKFANQTLTVKDGASLVGRFTFAGSYSTSNFALASDGHGGTNIGYVSTHMT
jgi:hypothetical protein